MSYLSPPDHRGETPTFRYQLLRIALQQGAADPASLEAAALTRIRSRAAAHCRWQARVLRAPEAAGVWVPETQVDRAIEIIASRFPDREGFGTALQRVGITRDELRQALAAELRAEAAAERVARHAAAVPETAVRAYYETHPEQFIQPERRAARHILITVNPEYPENRPAAALTRLREVETRMGGTPEEFAAQAERHSECPSSLDGGILGWVSPGTLYPELDRTLFRLAEGGVSEVVESPLGYHLLRCDAVQAARRVRFTRAAADIRRHLEERERRRALRAWAAGLPPMGEGQES